MSAETLRKTAALMRERANDAILATGDEPWGFVGLGYNATTDHVTYRVANSVAVDVCDAATEEQAVHVASWHPAVALAVAEWLDVWADSGWVECECNLSDGDPHCEHSAALAVARRYLGDDA